MVSIGPGFGVGPNPRARPGLPCVSTRRGWAPAESAALGFAVASHEDQGRARGTSCCAGASHWKIPGGSDSRLRTGRPLCIAGLAVPLCSAAHVVVFSFCQAETEKQETVKRFRMSEGTTPSAGEKPRKKKKKNQS